jgi:hypothetical protein
MLGAKVLQSGIKFKNIAKCEKIEATNDFATNIKNIKKRIFLMRKNLKRLKINCWAKKTLRLI